MIVQVIPDTSLSNTNLESLFVNLHQYKSLVQRLTLNRKNPFTIKFTDGDVNIPKPALRTPLNLVYEMYITKGDISFYYHIPDQLRDLASNEFSICYPKSTLKETTSKMLNITKAVELELEHHSFLSLRVNKGAEFPLTSLLESSKILRDDEAVLVQYIFTPVDETWYMDASQAIEDFNKKIMTRKFRIDKKSLPRKSAKVLYYVVGEAMDLLSQVITNEPYELGALDEVEYSSLFRKGLSDNTHSKSSCLGYDTSVRIATNSKERGSLLMTLFSRSYNTLTEDNRLIERPVSFEKLKNSILERKGIFKLNKDVLSTREIAQLTQLPTVTYQQMYKMESIDTREIQIPATFSQPGIQIADASLKGKTYPLNIPVPENRKLTREELDSICQVWLTMGKMGTGKTTNNENVAIQMLQRKFSVFAVDVADGKMIDNIIAGLPKNFDMSKVVILDFGDIAHPIPLTWNETAMIGNNISSETKLASQLRNFLNKLSKEPTSDRMDRFLGACAKATFKNPMANLYDVVLCITDPKYRKEIIKKNNIDGRLKYTLEQMDEPVIAKTLAGIMDRLDGILDSEYAANCLLQTPNPEINFRKWADEGYFVGIKVPKDKLLDDATDLLVTFLVSKWWLSILTRSDIEDIDARIPSFLILDEPHQFPTVLKELYSIIREMRKWRAGTIISAHEFGDFKSMKSLLKNAGTNYFIYPTGKDTYRELIEELAPYTLEECMKTKWRHAIINMRYKSENVCVMAHMIPPLPKVDRPAMPNVYGRPVNEVQEEIMNRMFGSKH
jgi:hypothetical protein